MKTFYLDLDPANTDTDYFCDGVIGLQDVALTQLQTATPDGLAHQVCIVDMETTDHSGNTFTITGTDADDRAQTEAVTGPASGATVESAKFFKTVTSVVPSVTIVATESVDIGFVDEFVSPTVVLDGSGGAIPKFQAVQTGTMAWSLQTTLVPPGRIAGGQEANLWVNDTTIHTKSASVAAVALGFGACAAIRFICTSYTNTAEIQIYGFQPTPASNQ